MYNYITTVCIPFNLSQKACMVISTLESLFIRMYQSLKILASEVKLFKYLHQDISTYNAG